MRRFFSFASSALVMLTLSAQNPSRPTSSLSPVIERFQRWSGGAAAWDALTHLCCEGEFTLDGRDGKLMVAFERAGRVRQDYEVAGLRGSEGIDAMGPWRRNQSGQIEGLPANELLQLRESLELAFGGLFRGTLPGVRDGGRRERAGDTYDVVVAESASGRTSAFWFTGAGELRYRDATAVTGTSTTEFAEWRSVGGVRMPFRETRTGLEPRTLRWHSIVANSEASQCHFDRDTAASRPTSLTGGAATHALPIDLYLDRYLFAKGTLAGIATDIVLDSGAGITVVDRELAQRAGLKGFGEITAKGVGAGTRQVQLAQDVSVTLGKVHLDHLTVAILDLTEVHEKLGRRMPVILGKELFHAFTIECDYAGKEVRVHDPEGWIAPEGAVVAPTRPLDDGHVMIELAFEDLPAAWFMVDTGSGDTLALHQPYVVANRLLARYPRVAERRIGGVGGMLSAKEVSAGTLRLAGQEFRDVPVILAIEAKGVFGDANSAGTLGAGLLGRFTVTFDYPRQRLLFVPNARVAEPFLKDRLGIGTVVRDGKLVVEYVSPGSPGEAAAVRVGDVISAVGDVKGSPAELRSALRTKVREQARKTLALEFGERTVVVALAEFY